MKIKPHYKNQYSTIWHVELNNTNIIVNRNELTKQVEFDVTTYDPLAEDFGHIVFGKSHIKVFTMLFYRKDIELIGFNTLEQ